MEVEWPELTTKAVKEVLEVLEVVEVVCLLMVAKEDRWEDSITCVVDKVVREATTEETKDMVVITWEVDPVILEALILLLNNHKEMYIRFMLAI